MQLCFVIKCFGIISDTSMVILIIVKEKTAIMKHYKYTNSSNIKKKVQHYFIFICQLKS
jgi:hypothetical protein